MRIIRKGNTENFTKQIECKLKHEYTCNADKQHCGSILEINQDDVFYKEYFSISHGDGYVYVVKCSVCGCILELDENGLPEWVKYMAKDKKM